jgi:hypothetical protein
MYMYTAPPLCNSYKTETQQVAGRLAGAIVATKIT